MEGELSSPEWSMEDWLSAWHIGVGRVFACQECSNMIMVTKGGTGNLEPKCHGKKMKLLEKEK